VPYKLNLQKVEIEKKVPTKVKFNQFVFNYVRKFYELKFPICGKFQF
jgi:hypothetical protein